MSTLHVDPQTRVVETGDSQERRGWDWSACVPSAETLEAMEDVRLGRNLIGPFATAEEAVRSMLEGAAALDDDEEGGLCTP